MLRSRLAPLLTLTFAACANGAVDAPPDAPPEKAPDAAPPRDASEDDVPTTDVSGDHAPGKDTETAIDVPAAPDAPSSQDVATAPDAGTVIDVVTAPDIATVRDVTTPMDTVRTCRDDGDCAGSLGGPACDVGSGRCVPCVADAHCGSGRWCVAGQCLAGCGASRPCVAGAQCCGDVCADTRASVEHCGACGRRCAPANATAACAEGACRVGACAGGWGDCDGTPGNGCEARLDTEGHCGACGRRPAEACDLADDDCDGACDEGAGCRRGVHRSWNPSTGEHFYTTDLAESACCGFTRENENAFWLYAAPGPGLVALHRCALSRFHLYTTDPACERVGTLEGVMGYVSADARCGAVPLHRLVHPRTSDHLYTTDANERDEAVRRHGYVYEMVAGYVWPGP